MTQQYTPVAWQDETTSQQGTLINAERLNQMQTAHHFADGFEEVDAVPTADPSVAYHKVVYCTADSTFYRWDGTEWTKDIDDETKALLQQEIARATQADSQLNQRVDDEHDARVDAEAAIHDRITDEATELGQRIATEASTRYTADTALGTRITNETSARETADTNLGNRITAEATARAEADTLLGGRIDTEQARAEAAEQANVQAIANTYTKAEADTLLAGKASTTAVQALDTRVGALETGIANVYTKAETDTLLASKADSTALATKLDTLSTTGLHAYTHNGATQSEVAVIDGTTASTIPIRDANGRLQAADPASGATDKTLTTANWVSQTGTGRPNNLIHDSGDETVNGMKTMTVGVNLATILAGDAATNTWYKVAEIQATKQARITYQASLPYNNTRYYIVDAAVITPRVQTPDTMNLIKLVEAKASYLQQMDTIALAFDSTSNKFYLFIKTEMYMHYTLYATMVSAAGVLTNASGIITPITPVIDDPTTYTNYVVI